MMRQAIQICVLIEVVFISVNGDVIQLAPTSSDSLLLGCYSYRPDNNSTKQVLLTLSTNKTEMSCIEACANSAFKIALSNDSLCICSHDDNITSIINITDCITDVRKIYLHVYNTSRLLPGYCEVFDEIRFQIPPMVTLNITKNHEVELDFGDGNVYNLSSTIYNTSYVSHRYLKSGHYRVRLRSKSHNGSGCHAYRDVIVQQGVVVQGMSCPSHVKTIATILCRMDVLTGSNMTVDLEVVNQKNARIKQEFQLQDIEMVSVGNLRVGASSQMNRSLDERQGGTYVIPGERFHTTTVLQAWEVFATSNCSAKLQVFRPTRQSNCSMSCSWSTISCKKWSLLSNDNCNEVCLQIKSCNPNKPCILNNSSFESIFSLDVSLNSGYNFISVPNSMKAILVKFGDVLGWASNDSQCIQAIQGQNHEALFSSVASNWKTFSTQGNVTRKNVVFALRVHGFVPMDVSFTFCHSQPEIISVRSKIRNLISTVENSRFNETVIVQVAVSGTWYRIDDFMVVNESRKVIIKADTGTNLTCILKLANRRDIVYSPFKNGNQTEGLDYHEMVTFHKSEVVVISFKISNLVSEKNVSKSTAVRIQVKGLRASIKYAEFAYQNAETFYDACIVQGNFVEYHWIFEDPKKPYVNKSTTASHIFQNLGKFNATLYAHNNASYEGVTITTLVIPNPLSIQIPPYVKAGVPQAIGCQVLWPEGTPQRFYQKFNLSARKGADVPEKVDTILDFGDGKTMLKNSSVEIVYHTFASDKNKTENIKCTVQNHPELNIKKSVTVLDAISGVQIHTNCSRKISIGTMCNFEANFTGDLGQCRWAINDKDDTFFLSGNCAMHYKFERSNEYEVSVNVSNQVSSLFQNSTFVVSLHHISATGTIATSTHPTKTIIMETATLATLNSATSMPDVTSAVVMETSSIPPSTTTILISSITPNLTVPDLILVCPNYGAVGKEVAFEAYLTSGTPLSYSWKIDMSVLSKARRRLYHVFKSPGIYSVTSEVTSSNGNLSRTCRVTVQELVMGFRITELELLKDLNVEIGFEVLRGTNVTYEVDFGEEGVPKAKELLNSSPSTISLIHQYKTPRQYTISIHISSLVGPNKTINSTLLVVDGSCTINDVTIEGGSRDSSSAPIILPQYEYSVGTRVNASCDSAGTFSYTWMISNVANESTAETIVKIHEEVSLDGRELVLPSYTLPYGLNKLIATVKVNPHGISKSVIGYVKVREPDLVALIDCGNVRTVSREREVIFNASRSYDPGTSATESSSLFFKWFCDCNGNVSWIGDDISRNNSILYIPKMRLSNGECSFLVEVTKGTRKASAKQTINVVDGNFHSLCFRCIQNCDKKAHLNKAVVFTSTTCQENKNLSCTWKLTHSSGHNVKKRSLPFESYKFVISQEDFKPNYTYTVSLEAMINGVRLSNDYRLKTDNVPEGGACSISPSHGKVIETTFQIKCNGWGDEDRPLWYEYYYIDPDTGPTMMAYGWQPQSPLLYLPNGQESENYTLRLHVDVVDVLGSRKRVPLHAIVMGFSKNDGPIGAILYSYVHGPSSILEEMYNRGDDQQAIQFMTTISSVLNEDSLAQTESKGQGEREKVRTTLTKEFSNKTISSFPSLRQVLGGLRSATKITNEVTSDAQVYGAQGYENMALTLATKYVKKPIEKEADTIVKGLSDVLESSKMTSNKARDDEKMQIDWMDNSNAINNQEMLRKSQHAVTTCLNGADQTARALVRRKKLGDSPSLVQSGKLEIAVHRQPTSDVGGLNLDRTGSRFTLPMDGIQDQTKGFEFVDAKILTVKESPFPNQGLTPINSQVSSLELQDPSGNPIPINNLSQPISIFLNNAIKTTEVQSNISGVLDHEQCINITVYKIKVMEKDVSIYLEANCTSQDNKLDSHCILMWRKNKHPDFVEHDHSWKISQMNGTFKTLLTSEMLNGTGDYFLGISRDRSRNISCDEKRNTSVIFNVTVNVVNCLYWDEGKQNWSNTGCQVGPHTNRHRIHCLCNHLTWFGSKILIPPNSLDLEKIALRISDPSYYLPVLAVLCTIWLVYVLAIVWARRADKRDVLKTEVMISPSNQPGNKYIYEVAVTTGIRRHAGTTANTAIMIYGELHDSEPYLLTDNVSHRTLQRGTALSFLLTTKESLGPLLHIRIWHDNKGKDPALFLKHIVVRDIQNGETSHFLCNRWFAVDEGDGMIDRVLPITSEEEMAQFSQMFLEKTQKDLTDSHLWFSVIWRPPHSPFTRVQRVSCCLSLLLCTMMANAMWYEKDKGSYTAVDLGPFQFSWEQISIGIMSSLVVFPISLILVQIFRHSKLRRSPDIPKRQQTADSNKVTPMKFVPPFMPSNYYPLKNERSSSLQLSQMEQEICKNHNSLKQPRAGLLPLKLASVFVIPRISKSSKQVESSREDCCNNLIAQSIMEGEQKERKRKAFRVLPYWCSYIGWAGIAVTSLASTAVTLMYGIEFGRRTSEKWLFSMFVSVTQDIFVSQPLKVIVFAVIFAFIIKKPNLNDHSDKESDMGKRQRLTQSRSMHCTTIQAPCVPVTIPSEDTLEMARKRRFQEKQMAVILSDIVTYMFFLLIILLISYGQRDKSSFLQKESVEELVMRTNYSGLSKGYRPDQFQKASKVADVWQWLENVLLPIMYNIQWYYYTGRPTPFIEGGSGMSVGVARLRQLRIKKGGCQVPDGASFLLSKCTMPYSMTSEDENSYLPGWVAANTSNPSHDPLWHYSSATQLRGFPVIGNIETYSGGGYVLTFSPIYYKALQQIHKAKDQLWIDKFSKAVFVEFNLYNPSSNLFTACIVLIEFMQTGGFTIKPEFLTYRLYRYVGDFQLFVVAMEVFFLLFVIYFTYREGKSIYKNRCQYFKSSWVWIEIIITILSWVTIAHYFICFGIRKLTLQQYLSDPSNFTNFHYISTWQQVFENFMALTVFVAFFKIIKLLNFNKRMYILAHTLKHAAKDLGSYWCIFLLIYFAFSQLYFLMLGSEYLSFSTLIRSMEKLLSVILGKFSFEEFMNPFRILGAITFILYMIVMKFLLLNILIVLVISSFKVVKQSNKKLNNDFEIVDFMVEQLKALSGIRFLNKRGFIMDRTDTISESISDRENQTLDSLYAHGQFNELLFRVDKLESLLMEQDHCDRFDELLYKYLCVHRHGNALGKKNVARKKTFGDRLEITKK